MLACFVSWLLLTVRVGPCVEVGQADSEGALKPTWKGLHMVILSTPVAVKVVGITPWIHHTQVKKVKILNAASKLWTHENLNMVHIGPSTPWSSTSS